MKEKIIWNINNKISTYLHFTIGEMIAVDNLPLLTVENIGFKWLWMKTIL